MYDKASHVQQRCTYLHDVHVLGRPRVILWGTCAPPVEFCEVDPMQTESLACTIVESSPPDPCICAQKMVCRLSMRSLNRSGCARARADDSGIQGGARARARYLHSGVTWIPALLAFWRYACLYLRAHARALRHIRVFSHMHAI